MPSHADIDLLVYAINGAVAPYLLKNDGSGVFSTSADTAIATITTVMYAAFGDVDGDGDQDLIVLTGDGCRNKYLTNDGTGTFTDVSGSPISIGTNSASGASRSVSIVDIDGDGGERNCLCFAHNSFVALLSLLL